MRRDADQDPPIDDDGLNAPTVAEALEPDELLAETAPAAPPAAGADSLPGEDGVIRAGKLAGRTMWGAIAVVALPVLLQQLMQACVGLVDKLLAGHLPAAIARQAMDGIGLGSFVGWFVNIALMGLGVGGQAIIARSMGAGARGEGERALGQSMTLSILWGIAVGVVMWFLASPLAWVAGLTPEATELCERYVRIVAIGMPFCGVMMVGTMCLHGAGEATKPFWIAVLVNIVNTGASWFLSGVDIHVGATSIPNPSHLDPMRWGVFGIAAGTTMSYAVGAIATLWVLGRGVHDLRLERRAMRLEREMTRRIVRVGIPSFLEGFAMWAVQLFVMHFIGLADRAHDGEGGLVGAHTIAVQWEAFSFLPGFAMGTAAGAVAGQYLGAGNPRMARRAIWACTLVGVGIMGSLGIVFMTQGELLTRLISREPVHLDVVPKVLFICGMVQIFFALAMVVRNGLRGVGDTTWILVITLVSCYLVRLPAAYVLGVTFGLGLVGIWMGLCGELVVRGLLFLARFVWGRWDRLRV
ncbi:MAG: MATE family efflux transporter [Phycisphaerales bacterium]